jgi:hypothetical protein
MEMRNEEHRILDSVLLLYLLEKAAPILGRTKVQKTVFLAENALREQGLVGPHFRFFRYFNGPFSRQLLDTFDELAERGLVTKTTFQPTRNGRAILELAIPNLRRENPQIFKVLDEQAKWCRGKHGSTLMEHTYRLVIRPADRPDTPMKVLDMPSGLDIIDPPSGGMTIRDRDAFTVLKEQLAITPEELQEARRKLPELEKRAFNELSAALNEDRPS